MCRPKRARRWIFASSATWTKCSRSPSCPRRCGHRGFGGQNASPIVPLRRLTRPLKPEPKATSEVRFCELRKSLCGVCLVRARTSGSTEWGSSPRPARHRSPPGEGRLPKDASLDLQPPSPLSRDAVGNHDKRRGGGGGGGRDVLD